MVRGFVVLLLLQLAGEVISRGLRLPVPGPVLGLVFLLRLEPVAVGRTDVARVAEGLLQNLALLFVPAGVGVVQQLKLLSEYGLAIAIALVGSTAVTLTVTVLVFTAVARRTGESDGGPIA